MHDPDYSAINTYIDKNLNIRFRKKIGEKYGQRKGALKCGLEDAIELWLECEEYFDTRE